jgi:hypothetical protein
MFIVELREEHRFLIGILCRFRERPQEKFDPYSPLVTPESIDQSTPSCPSSKNRRWRGQEYSSISAVAGTG